MTLLKKLRVTSSGMALIGLTVSGLGFWQVMHLAAEAENVVSGPAKKLDRFGGVNLELDNLRITARNLMVYSLTGQDGIMQEQIVRFHAGKGTVEEQLAALLADAKSAEEKALLETLRTNTSKWIHVTEDVIPLCVNGQGKEAALKSSKEGRASALAVDAAKAALWKIEQRRLHDGQLRMDESRQQAGWTAGSGIAAMLIAAGLQFFALSRFRNQLTSAVKDLSRSSDQMAGAATQIASASQSLANTASEQSASLHDAAASAEQVTISSTQGATKAGEAALEVSGVAKLILRGNQTVATMRTAMTDLRASSSRISEVIRVIEEIAFQTNILALNAAIEAAHAGKEGLGFAVVADEVRTLAQRSADAARNTEALVADSLSKSESGADCARAVESVFQDIQLKTEHLLALTEGVRNGSELESKHIGSVATTVVQLNDAIHNTAAAAQESASASSQMTEQARTVEVISRNLAEMIGA